MKSIVQQIVKKNKERENAEAIARQAEIDNPSTKDNRRNFLKKTALGGITMTGLMGLSFDMRHLPSPLVDANGNRSCSVGRSPNTKLVQRSDYLRAHPPTA